MCVVMHMRYMYHNNAGHIYIFLKGVLGRGVGDPPSGGCGGGTQNPIMATDGRRRTEDGQNMLIRNISGSSLQNGLKLWHLLENQISYGNLG